nr:Trm112 family protein [Tomitella cavernea]
MELDPVLAEVLACPAPDHGALRAGTPQDPDADVLTCTVCGRMYPVVDGIPVMLLDEAVFPDAGAAGRAAEDGELPT